MTVNVLLLLHSWTRWLVLLSLFVSITISYRGWKQNLPYQKKDNLLRILTSTFCHLQLLFGVYLYFISPITNYFLSNFKEAISIREIRFFGMEHSSVMFLAIVLITIGAAKAKRQTDNKKKHKITFVWFLIGFLFILSSIPWSFSPLVSRPLFR